MTARTRTRLTQALAFLQFCVAAFALPYDAFRATTFCLTGVVLLVMDEVAQLRRRVRALERRLNSTERE